MTELDLLAMCVTLEVHTAKAGIMCPSKWLHYLIGVLAVGRIMETPMIHLINYHLHKLTITNQRFMSM